MLTSRGLIRIFWPLDIPRTEAPGVIVGWKNSDSDFFVLNVLEHVEVSRMDVAKRLAWLTCLVSVS